MRRLLLYGRIAELERLSREVAAQAAAQGDAAAEAEAKNYLGQALGELFRSEDAHACFVEALSTRSALFGPSALPTLESAACLAEAAWALDRVPEALAMHRRALAALPAEPAGEARVVVAGILKNLGLLETRSRREDRSRPLFRRALSLVDVPAVGLPEDEHELEIASACVALGMTELDAKHDKAAARLFERAHEIRVRRLGDEHEYVAYTTHHLGAIKMKEGDLEGAQELVQRALEMIERCVGKGHPNVATELTTLGAITVMMGESDRSVSLLERAIRVEEAFFGPDDPHVAATLVTLALVHAGEERPALAEPLWRRALALLAKVPERRPDLLQTTINNLFITLRVQNKHKDVLAFAEPLISRWELDPRVPSETLTALWNGVSEVYYREKRYAKAEKILKRALSTAESRYGKDARELRPILSNLVQLLRGMGRWQEARTYEHRIPDA